MPAIEKVEYGKVQWVYNIDEGLAEVDRVPYRYTHQWPTEAKAEPDPTQKAQEEVAIDGASAVPTTEGANAAGTDPVALNGVPSSGTPTEQPPETARDVSRDFFVVQDMKWDGGNIKALYLQMIACDRRLRSLRDLRAEHLPLLRDMRDRGLQAISAKYKTPRASLLAYFHYPPSYYQLHVHVVLLGGTGGGLLGTGPGVGARIHFLDDVVCRLELCPAFFERATFTLVLRDNDRLVQVLEGAPPDRPADQINK